jgi:ubiquinone/menaquinone biosynthesis C-methylase UbiE/DNA-binding MarR family transcriptional regulator
MMLRPAQNNQNAPILLWMQSLSDPTRARLLRLLDRSELTVAEMCTILQLPQSTVSRHLKVLLDDGWVAARRDGTSNLYRMPNAELDQAQKKLWSVVKLHAVPTSTSEQDDARLEQAIEARRSKSHAFFSSAAEKWDRMRAELFGHRIDAWAFAAALPSEAVVGDLGCGTGSVAQTIAPWVEQVIAVDSSAAMLQSARKRLRDHVNVDLRRAELTHLPMEDGTLTHAILVLVLPYMASPQQVFDEAFRVTRSGGKLIIVDMMPHDRSEYRDELGHSWQGFSANQIQTWMNQSGWCECKIVSMPQDPDAKGTGLFVASAVR